MGEMDSSSDTEADKIPEDKKQLIQLASSISNMNDEAKVNSFRDKIVVTLVAGLEKFPKDESVLNVIFSGLRNLSSHPKARSEFLLARVPTVTADIMLTNDPSPRVQKE